ncbi:MAG TPA: glycosyltransferase family 2 protein [Actinomycetota bacterium]|nr:glycosyltransferase family 2 protein [Actinomycetota bacterium]
MSGPQLSLIVPCLNEEQNIPVLVEKLQEVLRANNLQGEILIVDDCSDDYTFKEALLMEQRYENVRALHKGLPRGIGNAIRFGIDHAKGEVGAVVMGDLVDPLHALPDFVDHIVNRGAQLALLSRYMNPEDSLTIPRSYRVYQWLFRSFCHLFLGIGVRDITYAYRGFSLDWVRSLNLQSDGFEISPEITLKTFQAGGNIVELKGRQGRRLVGESKFFFSKEGFGYARVLLEAVLRRVLRTGMQRTLTPIQGSDSSGTSSPAAEDRISQPANPERERSGAL